MGWFGWALAFTGLYMLGNQNKNGFLVSIAGGVALLIHASSLSDVPGLAANVLFMAMHTRNYMKWRAHANRV